MQQAAAAKVTRPLPSLAEWGVATRDSLRLWKYQISPLIPLPTIHKSSLPQKQFQCSKFSRIPRVLCAYTCRRVPCTLTAFLLLLFPPRLTSFHLPPFPPPPHSHPHTLSQVKQQKTLFECWQDQWSNFSHQLSHFEDWVGQTEELMTKGMYNDSPAELEGHIAAVEVCAVMT